MWLPVLLCFLARSPGRWHRYIESDLHAAVAEPEAFQDSFGDQATLIVIIAFKLQESLVPKRVPLFAVVIHLLFCFCAVRLMEWSEYPKGCDIGLCGSYVGLRGNI